ncbi:MAG: hypothetical protein U0X39_13645 [Bacteroidales bacterium]
MRNTRIVLVTLFSFGLLLLSLKLESQIVKVSNIHWRIINNKIEVFYDLPINRDSLEIKVLFAKKSDPPFRYRPVYVYGSVGKGIYSGKENKIVWSMEKEPPGIFTGDGFWFIVTARKIPKKLEMKQVLGISRILCLPWLVFTIPD